MKMVIRGAQAPKCEEKPRNPTSSSQVGTMTGSVAGGKRRGRGKGPADAHQPQYQGLLQAPRLPGMFDQQHGRASPDSADGAEEATGEGLAGSFIRRGPTGLTESPFMVGGAGGEKAKHGQAAGQDQGLGPLPKDAGKPPKTSQPQQHRAKTGQRYHYQKFGGQSATSFGGAGGQRGGAGPGQKSIKQQRDLAQLRFYQTLTNQPHLISQSHSQGKQMQQMPVPSQVKMLSNMRLAQQPSRSQNRGQQQPYDLQDSLDEHHQQLGHPSGLAAEGRRSLADRWPQRPGPPGAGQVPLRPGQGSRGEAPADHPLHYQARAKTPQRAGSGVEGAPGATENSQQQAEMADGAAGRATAGQGADLNAVIGARSPGALQVGPPPGHGVGPAQLAIEGNQLTQELSGKEAHQVALAGGQVLALGTENNDRMGALVHQAETGALPQRQPELVGSNNAEHLQPTDFGAGEDPYDQKRGPQNLYSADDQRPRPPVQRGKQPQLLSHILNGPVLPAAAGRAPQHESVRTSESYVGALRGHQALNREGMAGRSHSPRARPGVEPSSRSREREGRRSPSRSRGKNGASRIAKIEKKNQHVAPNDKARGVYNVAATAEEDFARRMERFSSQGQEELVQAYQLPTVYAGNDSRAGFHGYQSQPQPKKRNQTSYGGPRNKAGQGLATRDVEGLRDSVNSVYKMMAGTGASASGNQLIPLNRQVASVQQPGAQGQAYRQAASKGTLNNILVKACSFQAREGAAEKRDQIRTAYTITRAGRLGMGVLPQIDAKIAEHPEVLGVPPGAGGHEGLASTRDGALGRDPMAPSISLGDGQTGKQPYGREYNQTGKMKQDTEIPPIQEYQSSRRAGGGLLAAKDSGPKHCKRFMERGNKPVPSNYEEHDALVMMQKGSETAAGPYPSTNEAAQKENNANAEVANQSGKAASRQSGRQMVYGNLKLGKFDEEISGINLSKLFSVYGPQSAEGRRRKKARQSYQSSGMQHLKNRDLAKSSPYRGFESYQSQQQKSAHPQQNGTAQPLQGDPLAPNNIADKDINAAAGAPAGLAEQLNAAGTDQGVSPSGAKGISSAGNLLKMDGQAQPAAPILGTEQHEEQQRLGTDHQEDFDDLSDEEESDDDEEEPLIIQLMESMFTRKKTVQESEQMISEISVDAIRQEIRRLALQEKCRLTSIEREKFFQQRMNDCEKLNELIQRENQDLSESILGRPDHSTRENPFYLALKAQKEERERYKKLLQLAIMNGVNAEEKEAELPKALMDGPASQATEAPTNEDGANDIFKHTFVDVLDDDKLKPAAEEKVTTGKDQKLAQKRKDIFYFYNLSFDLPTEYYKQLGDFSLVNQAQATKIKEFMLGLWPMLRGKKVQYKIAYDLEKEVFNVVLLGKDCPLSKCCKMTVYFQFTKDIGGKVICMENLCALNPLDHFFIELDLVKTLFYDYPLGQQQADPADAQGQPNAGTDLMKQLMPPETMTRGQFKKLKPTFRKVISQEISKMISKGTHMNLSIRDVIANQNLEQKVQHQANKGKVCTMQSRQALGAPKRLTQSKLLRLLYDTSSQASSQLSQLGLGEQQAFDGEFGGQPMGSIHWTGNEDMAFVMDNQEQYPNGQLLIGSVPQDLVAGPDGFQWAEAADGGQQYATEVQNFNQHGPVYKDGLALYAPDGGGDQTAVLFSQSMQDQDPQAMQQHRMNMIVRQEDQPPPQQQRYEQQNHLNNTQAASGGYGNLIQKNGAGSAAATGSQGTSNPGPSLIGPALSDQQEQVASGPVNSSGSGQAQAPGDAPLDARSGSDKERLNVTDGAKAADGSVSQEEAGQGK